MYIIAKKLPQIIICGIGFVMCIGRGWRWNPIVGIYEDTKTYAKAQLRNGKGLGRGRCMQLHGWDSEDSLEGIAAIFAKSLGFTSCNMSNMNFHCLNFSILHFTLKATTPSVPKWLSLFPNAFVPKQWSYFLNHFVPKWMSSFFVIY